MMDSQQDSALQGFCAQLSVLFDEKFSHDESEAIKAFSDCYYASAPLDEYSETRFDDIYGATIATWEFIKKRKSDENKIRVYNPNYECHGWQSKHSVIEILTSDMPFLIDTVRIELESQHIAVHSIINTVLNVERNATGLLDLFEAKGQDFSANDEAIIHLEVDLQVGEESLGGLQSRLAHVIHRLKLTVDDYPNILSVVGEVIQSLKYAELSSSTQDGESIERYLSWLTSNNFTFLAYKKYKVKKAKNGRLSSAAIDESCLGFIKEHQGIDLIGNDSSQLKNSEILSFAKSQSKCYIHRNIYPDVLVVKEWDEAGNFIATHHFLGFYTSNVHDSDIRSIPIVRDKVENVRQRFGSGLIGHEGRMVRRIAQDYPRDDLFLSSEDQLYTNFKGILHIQERRCLRLFVREDVFGRFVSCLVFVPRDEYSTALRLKFQSIFMETFGGVDIQSITKFSESSLARTQFVICLSNKNFPAVDIKELEKELINVARAWDDDLYESLLDQCGEEKGISFFNNYRDSFPVGYRDMYKARTAVYDIEHMEALQVCDHPVVSFYRVIEDEESIYRVKIFVTGNSMALSDALPVLENFGFKVLGELPTELSLSNGHKVWLHDFVVQVVDGGGGIDFDSVKVKLEKAFVHVWEDDIENDRFNCLIASANISWRDIIVFRAYAKYFKQICFQYSQSYIEDVLIANVNIVKQLFDLFEARFLPDVDDRGETKKIAAIKLLLDDVKSLDADRILRKYLDVILATVRTNFYQSSGLDACKPYASFKLIPSQIPGIPLPLPAYEIYVYSTAVEGVHLRGGKVARGGLRWSDRKEDFRTEVLGLVKSQQVKNSVIVPVGAKGGFIAKHLGPGFSHAEVIEEVTRCYKVFISGLLDLTDNLKDDVVIPPMNTVRHDEDDCYLVVAADKGTAQLSDVANEIALKYDFWLGDAFASGGSVGYDHKKMGITAKGAWVSVQRHFRELGIDVQNEEFSVIGIGDMSGDVFGNGMLLSQKICLRASFNHMHIFIDPNPNAGASYIERKRLFDMPRSTWGDYNRELISSGGGVYSRDEKKIVLSPEAQSVFGLNQSEMTPNELIKELLKAPADLLWIGGIGTYIKSSDEGQFDANDKTNDSVRVNGKELRCRAIGEGGNLGVTQLGRIEFGLNNGLVNTDFIDNAGGVNCSDNEVNIKILLDKLVAEQDMTYKQRNNLLEKMTSQVSQTVLYNNYRQTQALSLAYYDCENRLDEYGRYIEHLESSGKMSRALEFIPASEELVSRKDDRKGLTRPELAVLLSYAKGIMKDDLALDSSLDDVYLSQEMYTAFPKTLVDDYPSYVLNHKLSKRIVATQLANAIGNFMGPPFIYQMIDATGASAGEVAKAFVVVRDIFQLESCWKEIESLDYELDAMVQLEAMAEVQVLIRHSVKWVLRNCREKYSVESMVQDYFNHVAEMRDIIPSILSRDLGKVWADRKSYYINAGMSESLAGAIASMKNLHPALSIIQAATSTGQTLSHVAKMFFSIGESMNMDWFSHELDRLEIDNHWQMLARDAYRDDLDWQQRALTILLLNSMSTDADIPVHVDEWRNEHQALLSRWDSIVDELKLSKLKEFSMFSVALRDLLDIVQTVRHQGENG